MRRPTLLLLSTLAACAPWNNEDWPAEEEFEARRVEPVVPTQAVTDCEATPKLGLPEHEAVTIDLQFNGKSRLEPGDWLEVKGRLRNRSDSVTHRVVLPGDGSEVAWREPEIWYSAFRRDEKGCWRPVERAQVLRCGMFDHDWHDEIVDLAPGEGSEIKWMASPSYMLELQEPGPIMLFMHYAWRAGEKVRAEEPVDLGKMSGIDKFEIVSNPIEFNIVRPLDIVVTPRERKAGRSISRVSDLVTVQVRNVGKTPRSVQSPNSSTLRFEVKGSEESWPVADYKAAHDNLPAKVLAPGKHFELVGRKAMTPDLRHAWVHDKDEVVLIRAEFHPYADKRQVTIRSEWVELDLRK